MPHKAIEIFATVAYDGDTHREELIDYLNHSGMKTNSASTSIELDQLMSSCIPDMLILDLNLPGERVLNISKRLRQNFPKLGIVVLTGRTSQADRIGFYESGADFYIVKPVSGLELVHAIRALYGRIRGEIQTQRWQINSSEMTLTDTQTGQSVRLTRNESMILRTLAVRYEKVLTFEQVFEIINPNAELDSFEKHNMEALISRLRKKLSLMLPDSKNRLIHSVRGYGYQLSGNISIT